MRCILLLPFVSLSLMAQERLGLPQAIAAALAARPRLKAEVVTDAVLARAALTLALGQ